MVDAMIAMTLHVALFRGINVGGRNVLPRAALRSLLRDLGFENPRSVRQSGNLVFGADAKHTPIAIEQQIEAAVQERFGTAGTLVVRTAAQWASVVACNPFPGEAGSDPAHMVVMALKTAPDADAAALLRVGYPGRESIAIEGREAYLVYPDGIGRSRLTHAVLEKKLGVVGTARNWNTVLELAELAR